MAVNPDRAEARNDARATVAFYAGMRQYEPMFAAMGFGEQARACCEAFERKDMTGWVGAVSDEMAETFVVLGTADDCRRRVAEVWDLADSFCLVPRSAACRRTSSCSTPAASSRPSTARQGRPSTTRARVGPG